MAFCINRFEVGGHFYTLPKSRKTKPNRITVVVGPNGIGKTRLLAELVYQFTDRRNPIKHATSFPVARVEQGSRDNPSRVIAQTFSPFSRFPREKDRSIGLNDYLTDREERYAAIGFTKNMGFRGSVSKEAVGRVIRKLFTRPDHALPLATAMETLGFLPEIKLGFARSPVGRELDFTGQKQADLQSSVTHFLNSVTNKSRHLMEERKLIRELDIQAQDEIARHIEKAVLSLQSLQKVGKKGQLSEEYVLDLPLLHLGFRGESDSLEAVLTLTRLGVELQ